PVVILRRSRFPSRHGDTDLVRYIYPYVRAVLALIAGAARTPRSAARSERGPGGIRTEQEPQRADAISKGLGTSSRRVPGSPAFSGGTSGPQARPNPRGEERPSERHSPSHR